MNLQKSNKKFISIIWGYHKQIFTFEKEQNYHMFPLEVMKEEGYECEIFAINSQVKIEEDPNFIKGVNVIYYKNIFQYLFYLLKNSGAIIYSNSLTIKTLIVGIIGKRTFFIPHDNIFGRTGKNIFKKMIIKFFYRFFYKVRVNNSDELIEIDNIKKGLGYICPLVVSNRFLSEKIENRKGAVFIGNLTLAKNPEFLIDTFKILKNKNINFKVEIIGEDRYNKNGKNFQDIVKENHLENYIILNGFLKPELIKLKLEDSLIYINTSKGEGQCLAVYEGALAGNILCLPNIISFPSVFGKNALYHNTSLELANNIIYLLNNKYIIPEIIIRNQELILEKYNYKYIINLTKNMFLGK